MEIYMHGKRGRRVSIPETELCALYLRGWDSGDLADKYHCSHNCILGRLRKANIPIRRPSGRPRSVSLPMDEVRALASQGWSLSQLAGKYGCSIACVQDRMIENSIPRQPRYSQPGSKNGAWKGGRNIDADGYVLVWIAAHPFATSSNYVREHRLVMELKLNRYLTEDEVVHHIDGNRQNNHPNNLELFPSNADHLRATLTGKCPKWTEEGKRRMLEAVRRSAKNPRTSNQKKKENDAP